MELAEAAEALKGWKAQADHIASERDGLVRAAYAAGITIQGIRELSGLSRTTVYKILGLEAGPE
jgi:transcriptional regulator of acetoin/glycerol metabolism